MKTFPKITIVTPNYNGELYLEDTILSVINQNYPNLEYIIIDGGSTDNSLEIIKKYEKYITYWISEPDSGMYEAIQKGFEKSTGEIMAWINSDDMYHRGAFFTVSEIFSNFNNVQWITGANTNYDEYGRTFTVRHSYKHNKYSQLLEPNEYIQQESTFWRRTLWKNIGAKLDVSLKYAGDFELWAKFNRLTQVYVTDALIGGFRIRRNQLTQLYMEKYKQECQVIIEREKNLFSFYERSIFNEIIELRKKLVSSYIKVDEEQAIKHKIRILSNENDKITFNLKNQKFELRTLQMTSLLSTITKRRNNMKEFLEMIKFQHSYYPEIIIDVGVAQGTPELYKTFPESHFILFEALEEFIPTMNQFKAEMKQMDIEICALGNEEKEITINVHPDLVGSSIYLENEDSNVNGIQRTICMKTLDSFEEKYSLKNKNILLKIDVQGAEIDVLEGSNKLINSVDVIILEVSLFNFFNNNIIFADVIKYMDKHGFTTYDLFNFSNRPLDSALAQVDIAFVKKNSKFREQHIFTTKEQRIQLNKELTNKGLNSFNNTVLRQNNFNFSKQFNHLIIQLEDLKNSNDKYIIYGAGLISKFIVNELKSKTIFLVDQKSDLISENNIEAGIVYNPKNLHYMQYDKIIISVLGREDEIIEYLTKELNITLDKIIVFNL